MTNSNVITLVGWDDVLCRPIYRRGPAPVAAKKRHGKEKPDVTIGTSSRTAMNFGHPPLTPDEFKRARCRLAERLDDNTMLDACSVDKDVGEKMPKRLRQSRAPSPSTSDSDISGSKEDHKSCSPNQRGDISRAVGPRSKDSDEIFGVSFDFDNSEPLEIQSNNSIGTDILAETRYDVHIEAASPGDDGSHFPTRSTVVAAFGSGDSPTSSIRFDQSCPEIGIRHSNEAVRNSKIDCPAKGHDMDASDSNNGTKSVDTVFRDKNASNSYKKTILTSRMLVSSPSEQRTSASNQVSSRLAESASTNETINQTLNSPMILKSNRERFEPSDIDTAGISPFDDFSDPADEQCVVNQRSYGQGSRPTWASSKSSKQHKSMLDPKAGEKQLVGWDDIKCRPIYQVIKSEPSQSDVLIGNAADTEEEFAAAQNKLQKKQTYSSSFKKSETFKQAYHNMDLNSPVARRVTLESEHTRDDQDDTSLDELNGKDFLDLRLPELNTSALLQNESGSNSCDQDMENRIQPTSKTSIESARAFFRYLDENHNLTITCDDLSYERGSITHANVIRTTRIISHSHQLVSEYDEYCKTVDGTGVDPIVIGEFAKHWNMYFTERGIIRDGLLDED
jgi:hypothetical protein